MRTFVACRLDREPAAELERVLTPLRVQYGGKRFRWVAAENYHVTLRFFGEISAEAAVEIGSMIERVATAESPFDCRAIAPLPLPNARRPHVVALPIESNGRLERLAHACNEAFAVRFGAPEGPFRAHVTVIRCRPGARFEPANAGITFPFAVSTVGLYESTRVAGAARYAPLSEWEFARRGAGAA